MSLQFNFVNLICHRENIQSHREKLQSRQEKIQAPLKKVIEGNSSQQKKLIEGTSRVIEGKSRPAAIQKAKPKGKSSEPAASQKGTFGRHRGFILSNRPDMQTPSARRACVRASERGETSSRSESTLKASRNLRYCFINKEYMLVL